MWLVSFSEEEVLVQRRRLSLTLRECGAALSGSSCFGALTLSQKRVGRCGSHAARVRVERLVLQERQRRVEQKQLCAQAAHAGPVVQKVGECHVALQERELSFHELVSITITSAYSAEARMQSCAGAEVLVEEVEVHQVEPRRPVFEGCSECSQEARPERDKSERLEKEEHVRVGHRA